MGRGGFPILVLVVIVLCIAVVACLLDVEIESASEEKIRCRPPGLAARLNFWEQTGVQNRNFATCELHPCLHGTKVLTF